MSFSGFDGGSDIFTTYNIVERKQSYISHSMNQSEEYILDTINEISL